MYSEGRGGGGFPVLECSYKCLYADGLFYKWRSRLLTGAVLGSTTTSLCTLLRMQAKLTLCSEVTDQFKIKIRQFIFKTTAAETAQKRKKPMLCL